MKSKSPRAKTAVFKDLGFSVREADHLRVRAELMVALQEIIASRRLKQTEVARILGVTQPRVSNLLGGRLDLFSTDALIDLLASGSLFGSRSSPESGAVAWPESRGVG